MGMGWLKRTSAAEAALLSRFTARLKPCPFEAGKRLFVAVSLSKHVKGLFRSRYTGQTGRTRAAGRERRGSRSG